MCGIAAKGRGKLKVKSRTVGSERPVEMLTTLGDIISLNILLFGLGVC